MLLLVTPAAEAGDVNEGRARIDLLQPLEAEAELVRHAGGVIGDDDVGPLQQRVEHVLRVLVAEIERHRALAAIMTGEEQAVAVLIDLRGIARVLAGRRLDLDDVGAVIAQDHRGMRTGDEMRDFEHMDAGQRTLRRGLAHCATPHRRENGFMCMESDPFAFPAGVRPARCCCLILSAARHC